MPVGLCLPDDGTHLSTPVVFYPKRRCKIYIVPLLAPTAREPGTRRSTTSLSDLWGTGRYVRLPGQSGSPPFLLRPSSRVYLGGSSATTLSATLRLRVNGRPDEGRQDDLSREGVPRRRTEGLCVRAEVLVNDPGLFGGDINVSYLLGRS